MNHSIRLSPGGHRVTLCNHNYSHEGVLHPDRIMAEYDLLLMQQGEWDICEDETCYHVVPGMALLLRPGHHHYSREVCSPEMRNVYIHFTSSPEDDTDSSLQLSPLTDCRGSEQILHLMEQIIRTFWTEGIPHREERLECLMELLLLELDTIRRDSEHPGDVLIREIIHRFQTEADRFFRPAELAEDYGVSLRTISGRFKKATGQSIHQYQLNMKLTMAYDSLPYYPGRGLRDIAKSYGFYDEFQFSKLFKRKFGISPSARMKQ